MPEIGEIRKSFQIGKAGKGKNIWHACMMCGKERWVRVIKIRAMRGIPEFPLCSSCSPHPDRGFAEANGHWKGGRTVDKRRGYIYIKLPPDDFFYRMVNHLGYVFEHRLVVAKALGRNLHSWEIVHHKHTKYPAGSIEDKQDNRYPENLQLVQEMQHKQITLLENRISKFEVKVEEQGKLIKLLQWQIKEFDKEGVERNG